MHNQYIAQTKGGLEWPAIEFNGENGLEVIGFLRSDLGDRISDVHWSDYGSGPSSSYLCFIYEDTCGRREQYRLNPGDWLMSVLNDPLVLSPTIFNQMFTFTYDEGVLDDKRGDEDD